MELKRNFAACENDKSCTEAADTIYGLSVYLSGLTNKPRQTEASKKRAKGKKEEGEIGKRPARKVSFFFFGEKRNGTAT